MDDSPHRQLPTTTGMHPVLWFVAGVPIAVAAALALLGVTSIVYFALALIAGVGIAILVLIFIGNLIARRTGKYLLLSSRGFGYRYTSDPPIALAPRSRAESTHGLRQASLLQQLLFGFIELLVYAACVGLMLVIAILWMPHGY